jgi:hypothetical protein
LSAVKENIEMNTLTGIEAERVSQILRHAIDRLHILSYVPTEWDDDLAAGIACDPVLASLEKQWISEDQLKIIAGSSKEGGKDIAAVKQAHKATKLTCRNLLVERDSLQVLMSRPEVQCEDFLKFIRILSELKAQIHDRMSTTVEEEALNRTILQDLIERERSLEESKEALQAKLMDIKAEKEHVSFALDYTLKKLQLELQEISSHNTQEMDSVQQEMSDALSRASADHDLRMKQLQDQVDALERQMTDVVDKNREEEHRLRKEKGRAESTLNAKISQYDEDMSGRHVALDELKKHYSSEAAEYDVLKGDLNPKPQITSMTLAQPITPNCNPDL